MRAGERYMGWFVGGVFLLIGCGKAPSTSVPIAEASPPSFHGDNGACSACHKKIYEEWRHSRHAQSWTSETFRVASENYTRTECLPCHAPDLILRTGLDRQPELRPDARDSGVTCIVCHQDPNAHEWTMHGPYAVDSPAHRSIENPAYSTAETCAPCHGQKEEFNQYHPWKESRFGEGGFTCQACHAAPSERVLAETSPSRPTRWVADHRFLGAYDDVVLRSAVTLTLSPEEGGFRLRMRNETGHAFPGGAFREATLLVSVDGKTLDTVLFSFESGRRLSPEEEWSKSYPQPEKSRGVVKAILWFRRTVGGDLGLPIAEATLLPE